MKKILLLLVILLILSLAAVVYAGTGPCSNCNCEYFIFDHTKPHRAGANEDIATCFCGHSVSLHRVVPGTPPFRVPKQYK